MSWSTNASGAFHDEPVLPNDDGTMSWRSHMTGHNLLFGMFETDAGVTPGMYEYVGSIDATITIGEAGPVFSDIDARAARVWAWSLAIRALLDADRIEEAAAGARAALARAPHVTRGEVSRLAVELSQLAARLDSPRHAARLVGCVLAHDGPFELPLPAPTERERADAIVAAVAGSAVPSRLRDLDAGRRCTLREAAGDIFDEQRRPCP